MGPSTVTVSSIAQNSTRGISNGAIGGIVAGGVITALVAVGAVIFYKLRKLETDKSKTFEEIPQGRLSGLDVNLRIMNPGNEEDFPAGGRLGGA
jgi:hypothetical protein